MLISFTINSPPFSINSAYYKRSKTRTQACRQWGDKILSQIQDPAIQVQLESIKDTFDPLKHSLSVNLSFYIPSSKFFTKAGYISRHSMDLSNVEKLLIDLIFDERFNGRKIGKEIVYNLAIDDKFITSLHSFKTAHDLDYQIQIQIGVHQLQS